MRIHYLAHVPFEQLGSMRDYFEQRGDTISASLLYDGDALPTLNTFDTLIVMGGPMGADGDDQYPWMHAEKQCIADAIHAGKHVLGVCLGAQLIARVLGATVSANPNREIGWFPVSPAPANDVHPLAACFAPHTEVLHWHGDTFALPSEAVALLRSEGCENQAFLYREHVLGLQFHLELQADNVRALCAACPEDLAPGPWVMREHDMLAQPARFRRAQTALTTLLDRFFHAHSERD